VGLKDTATVHAYHKDRISRFGSKASEALGWKNKASQQQRFKDLAAIGNFGGRSVLDIGCGHGDLYPFLAKRYSVSHYTGLDNEAAFLTEAVSRYGAEANTRFLLGEFAATELPMADIVICCGALNYRNSDEDYIEQMIAKFFAACNLSLGLSLLKQVDFAEGILTKSEPDSVLGFCRQIAGKVELIDNHEQDYFTVFLHQEAHS
jgi:SAM-dependent methyltransferase